MWPVLTLPAGLAILLWAAILAVSRIMSLASMVAAISIPCSVLVAALAANGLAGVRAAVPFLVATGVIAAFVVWKHRANIARMRAGTEPKVGAKKPAGDGAASPETK
jgi:glycerol-3-phosphate acyltransferase PlsY